MLIEREFFARIYNMKIENRRKHHRINFEGMVDLQFDDYSYDCRQVKNLSLTGMFVKGNFHHQKMKDCQVKIFQKDKEGDNCLKACGRIVWGSDEGIGLEFTSMTFENYMLLMTTLRNEAEHPEDILRNFPEKFPFKVSHWV